VDLGSKHEPSELIRDGKAKGVALWVFLMGDPRRSQWRQGNGYPPIPYPDVSFAQKELRAIAVATGGDALVKQTDGYTLRKVIVKCKGKDE
jgi:hypothetical protein